MALHSTHQQQQRSVHSVWTSHQCSAPQRPLQPARQAHRGQPAVRTQVLADKPPAPLQPAAAADAEPAAAPPAASACPFLASLPEPPAVRVSFLQRFWQLTDPQRMQRLLLDDAGAPMVQMGQTFGFADSYVPGTGDAVRQILAGEAGSEPITRQAMIPSMVGLLGPDSLLFAADPKHKYLRGLLSPAFSAEAVASYLPQIRALVGRHIQDWVDAGDAGVQGFPAFKMLTFDFIVGLTFGRSYSMAELQSLSATYQRWASGFPAWPWKDIPLTPFWHALRARREMLNHFQEAVTEGRARLAAGQPVPGLLGNLLTAVDDDGNRLSDPEITDNILLLLLAGHDTSSTTLTRTFSYLQDHPAVVDKLRAEQAAVVAKHGGTVSAAALKDMPYADAVIRESLRLEPVVAGLMRSAARDFELLGFKVPAGKLLLLPFKWLASHDGRWAGQTGALAPDNFVPERMLTPEGLKPGDLMPFGHGPRYCLGANLAMVEMKMLLALTARHYSVTVDNNTEWVQAVGKIPKNGLPLVIKPLVATA